MQATSAEIIYQKCEWLKSHFETGSTKPINERIRLLRSLRSAIRSNQDKIAQALHLDLSKSKQESFITETGLVIKEIDIHLKYLRRWAKPKRVKTPSYLLPASSRLLHEPRGTVLIIAPWNYPFQLLMTPLVGAISAGNTAMLKPSEFCVKTNAVMEEIVRSVFHKGHVQMVHGGKTTNQQLFKIQFDLVYFTGSPF